jgi:hypothetical protein
MEPPFALSHSGVIPEHWRSREFTQPGKRGWSRGGVVDTFYASVMLAGR